MIYCKAHETSVQNVGFSNDRLPIPPRQEVHIFKSPKPPYRGVFCVSYFHEATGMQVKFLQATTKQPGCAGHEPSTTSQLRFL